MAKKNNINWFHADSIRNGLPPIVEVPAGKPSDEKEEVKSAKESNAFETNNNDNNNNKNSAPMNNGGYNNGGYNNGYNNYNNGMGMPNQYNINMNQSQGFAPMVQPLVLVPYSSPAQPIYHYPDGTLPIGDIDSSKMQQMGIGMQSGMPNMSLPPYVIGDLENTENRKKLNVKSLFLMIFSLFFVAVFGLGYFADKLPEMVGNIIAVTNENGFNIVYGLINSFVDGSFAPEVSNYGMYIQFSASLAVVMSVLTFIFALISIVRKRTALFVKILVSLLFVFTLVLYVFAAIQMASALVGIGLFILIGLSLVMFLLAIIEKKKEKKD